MKKVFYYLYLKLFAVFVFLKYFPRVVLQALWITIMGLYYRAWRISPSSKNIGEAELNKQFELEESTIL